MQVDGYVLGRVDGNAERALELLRGRVHHVALAVEQPLGEDHHGADDRLVGGGHDELNVRLHLGPIR